MKTFISRYTRAQYFSLCIHVPLKLYSKRYFLAVPDNLIQIGILSANYWIMIWYFQLLLDIEAILMITFRRHSAGVTNNWSNLDSVFKRNFYMNQMLNKQTFNANKNNEILLRSLYLERQRDSSNTKHNSCSRYAYLPSKQYCKTWMEKRERRSSQNCCCNNKFTL